MEKLLKAARTNESLLCIGLDPDPELMPAGMGVLEFNRAIVDATSDLVCAYKPNLAFYEALGTEGLRALEKTVTYIPDAIPVIGDAKRGDIGSTARAYARALFETLGFDAATVNPYLGYDSLEPFIEYRGKGVFILCRTSNAGSVDFQDLVLSGKSAGVEGGERPLFEVVALRAREWNAPGNVGLVVGATYPEESAPALPPDAASHSGHRCSGWRPGQRSSLWVGCPGGKGYNQLLASDHLCLPGRGWKGRRFRCSRPWRRAQAAR